jgi:hypothetical protein
MINQMKGMELAASSVTKKINKKNKNMDIETTSANNKTNNPKTNKKKKSRNQKYVKF